MALAGELDVGHRVEAQYVNPDASARTWYPAIVQKVEVVDGVKKFTVLFIGTRGALCLRCIVFSFGGAQEGCVGALWDFGTSTDRATPCLMSLNGTCCGVTGTAVCLVRVLFPGLSCARARSHVRPM